MLLLLLGVTLPLYQPLVLAVGVLLAWLALSQARELVLVVVLLSSVSMCSGGSPIVA